jgi:signal transduction histidine kinase
MTTLSRDVCGAWQEGGAPLCAIAWGTTELQNTGKLYVDWQWWWAQPIFSVGVVCLSIGIVDYLPIPPNTRIVLKRISVIPPIIYLTVVTVLLILEFKIIRAYAVWALIPSITVIAIASFRAEKVEPDKGHRLLGLLILCTPILTIAFPIFGLKTAVLRFWTAVPLFILAVTILAASLLRDRDVIKKSLDQLYAAETQLIALNKDLETRVQDRTALLNEIIADLESFNRNVSHDIRGPLGSIGLAAYLAQQQLNKGQLEQAKVQLQSISDSFPETFPDRHHDLAVDLLLGMTESFGPDAMQSVLARRGERLAKHYQTLLADLPLTQRVERLANLRDAEGYRAEASVAVDGSLLLTEHHCAIAQAAATCAGLCESELVVFRTALGSDTTVERVQFAPAGDGRCSYRISPR